MSVRAPAVAGMFYPADRDRLIAAIEAAFDDAVQPRPGARIPKALVAPHAGYVYSGAVAASAYLRVRPARDTIRRVVLLGPSHRVFLLGLAAPAAHVFDTPLGPIQIDDELRGAITGLPGVVVDDRPHADEHSLEVHLPFLQTVLDEFTLLPLSVGDASLDQVTTVLDAVWGGFETLVVVSTDLSHYHPYDTAADLDARTAAAILAGDVRSIGDRDACGARPLRGLLRVAGRRGMSVEQIDLRSSGDTAGDRDRVVGYGSFAVG